MSISLYRSVAQQYAQICVVNTVPAMNAISRVIEDQVIHHELPVNFYAGFQRFSSFAAQAKRYTRLAAVCRRVYVFGVPDITPPNIPGVELIPLAADDELALEWFLHVDTPDLWTTLATREEPGQDPVTGGRRFAGLWSFDSAVAERMTLLISQQLGTVYQPVRTRNLASQAQHIAEVSAAFLGVLERLRIGERRMRMRVQALQAFAATAARPENLQRVGDVPIFLLRDLVQNLMTLFGATDVVVAFAASREGEFHVVATDEHTVPSSSTLRTGEGISGRAISQGNVIIVNDARKSGERDLLLPGAAAVIAAPIIGRARTYGVIAVSGAQKDVFEAGDGQALSAIADVLALAIERGGELSSGRTESDYTVRFAQMIVRLRDSVLELTDLQERLEAAGPLSIKQRSILSGHARTAADMAQTLGVTRPKEITSNSQA